MSTEIDRLLSQLRNAPLPPGLAGLEEAVLQRIAARPQISVAAQLRAGMAAAFAAVLLGVASNGLAPRSDASGNLSPFGPSSPLAPSTLLAGPR